MTRLAALATLLFLTGCGGGGDDTDLGDVDCSDPDGWGGDTGDVPPLAGNWTPTVGSFFRQDACSAAEVPDYELDFLERPFLLEGGSNSIRVEFADDPTYALYGRSAPNGSLSVSGRVQRDELPLYVAVGGMVYEDSSGRTRWDGAIFVGADLNDDTIIDCTIRADWAGRKSGS